jgi:hypothetical protein
VFKGTTLTLTPRKVRFIRPDIAIVDIDCGVFGSTVRPPGVEAGADGALHTCLLLVLMKGAERGGSPRITMSGGRQCATTPLSKPDRQREAARPSQLQRQRLKAESLDEFLGGLDHRSPFSLWHRFGTARAYYPPQQACRY